MRTQIIWTGGTTGLKLLNTIGDFFTVKINAINTTETW